MTGAGKDLVGKRPRREKTYGGKDLDGKGRGGKDLVGKRPRGKKTGGKRAVGKDRGEKYRSQHGPAA